MVDAFHLGLTGWPLAHSLSPTLHQAALDALGLLGSYELFPIPPDQEGRLGELISQLRSGSLHGLNVTLPYKRTVIPLLDHMTETAAAIGAVNTIFYQDGQIWGDNTDATGFLSDLKNHFPAVFSTGTDPNNPPVALVLGAGGAARAAVYELLITGWQVFISARHSEEAEALAEDFKPSANLGHEYTNALPMRHSCIRVPIRGRLSVLPLDSTALVAIQIQLSIALVVNATSSGMAPNIDQNPWPCEAPLPHGAVVYDLVYNPEETALVRMARQRGLPAITGGGMLMEQAALSFERWTGKTAPRKAMQQALEEELQR